jgi:hypothetical protein
LEFQAFLETGKESCMRRTAVLLGTGLLLLAGAVGCSSNPRDALVNNNINVLRDATVHLRSVKDKVNAAVQKATSENKQLTAADLKPAVDAVSQLRDDGKRLQKTKEDTDALKNPTSPEEREELRKRFQGKWEEANVDLEKAQQELDVALRKAEERSSRDTVDELKKTLNLAEMEFKVLARQ